MIHGQSLTVGVAGYLQGLGVNPMGTSQRYGFGSEHVLEYTMVLADGSIAKVNKDNTTILKPGLSRQRCQYFLFSFKLTKFEQIVN